MIRAKKRTRRKQGSKPSGSKGPRRVVRTNTKVVNRKVTRRGRALESWEVENELEMSNTPIHTRSVCWYATSTTSANFLAGDFLKMMCCSVNGSTSSAPAINSYRIRHVRLIGVGDGTGNSRVDFTWANDNGPDNTHTLVFGPTDPVECVIYPNPLSEVARWKDENSFPTESMFVIDPGDLTGTIYLKVYFDLIYATDDPTTSGATAASGTAGIFYPLLPSSTQTFTAVGDVQTS